MKTYDSEKIYWLKHHATKTREEYLEIAQHGNVMPHDFPRTVYLEVGVECNLNCIFCSKPTRRKFDRVMDEATLIRVVDECADNGTYALYLHLFNEPLMHMKNLLLVISHAKK